ncbi:hypothetical protein BX666DRAFT_1339974 [Dichotomocladium elegans]|nr:hypothetical protein BX666DRAFT_1339974 [Dichotomocladium elegans]
MKKEEEPSDVSSASSYSSEEKDDYDDTKMRVVSQQLHDMGPIFGLEDPDAALKAIAQQQQQQQQQTLLQTEAMKLPTIAGVHTQRDGDETSAALEPIVRDFAYPPSSPLHYGHLPDATERKPSIVSLSSSEFTGRQARALYDFVPETEYEIGMKAGDVIWVQYRQSPGWLIADVEDETGLIPESYVEFI